MLKISANQRCLVFEDEAPFFYLGDTAWALFQRLDLAETQHYLEDRASKGFTVIQATALSEFDGLRVPNRAGNLPLQQTHSGLTTPSSRTSMRSSTRPPRWACGWPCCRRGATRSVRCSGVSPEVFTAANARSYSAYLGARYRDKPIIWMLGGDRDSDSQERKAIWRAMAHGLREGDHGRHLMTYHPQGVASSSLFFPDEPWLDFYTFSRAAGCGTGTTTTSSTTTTAWIHQSPAWTTSRTTKDMHVTCSQATATPRATTRARPRTGHCSPAHKGTPGRKGSSSSGTDRHQTCSRPPAWQRPWTSPAPPRWGTAPVTRVSPISRPRPGSATAPVKRRHRHQPHPATRARDRSTPLIYSAAGLPFTVGASRLAGSTLTVHWYDPRSGTAQPDGSVTPKQADLQPPTHGKGQTGFSCSTMPIRNFPLPGW